ARHSKLSALERSGCVPGRSRRSGDFDKTAGSDRRRGGARRQRDLFRHHGHQPPGRTAAIARMMAVATIPRRVAVELLSTQQELVYIVRVAVVVVLGVWLYLASALGDTRANRNNLLPYQAVIQNRPETDQRMFRELQEALLEAERVRSAD